MRILSFANISKFCSTVGRFSFLFFLPLAAFGISYAQPKAAQTEIQKQPYLVERSEFIDGKRDPRIRFDLRFGDLRENCTAWRFETSALSSGHALFELKEPADKKVLSGLDSGPQHIELVLGDANCNYRIRIERIR